MVKCPADGCEYEGDSRLSVSSHWRWRHDGKCPLFHVDRTCKNCGESFTVPRSWMEKDEFTGEFCEKDCMYEHRTKKVERTCQYCGDPFRVQRSEVWRGHGKYCSRRCAYDGMGPRGGSQIVECHYCGEEFREYNSRIEDGKGKFCDRECHDRHYAESTESGLEVTVQGELDRRGIRYQTQKKVGPWYVDLYLPEFDLIVEVDGDFWHSLDRMQTRDARRDGWMKKHGRDFIRLSESEINDDLAAAVDRVVEYAAAA